MPNVLRENVDGTAVLTFNRPEKLNALDYATLDELSGHLDDIEIDPATRVVVLTGAGDRAFSAGADIGGFAGSVERGVEAALREFVRRGQRLTSRIETYPKPIVAAVNGIAFGGGCEITEAAPLAIASERAQFGKPEIRLGFPPPFGGTQRLPRHVGRKRALAMILTGDPIPAREAAAIGLVNKVVPHDELLAEAHALARRIARHSPLAVAACLASVTRGINLPIDEGLAVEAAQFGRMVPTRDIREGIAAFLERREPAFSGV
ncbi:MAG TPA: crotonase/enoyl-CoA hydratase family protein [Beijerinckiaceae bacterium]|nr:crotonase/enoyl-CoA hydratase family protein [Beijerinckiaceae bacterium]